MTSRYAPRIAGRGSGRADSVHSGHFRLPLMNHATKPRANMAIRIDIHMPSQPIQPMPHMPPFIIHHSSFIIHHSSFIIHHFFVLRRNGKARNKMRWTRRGTSAICAIKPKLRRHLAAVCATTHARDLRLLFDQQSGKAKRRTVRSGRRAEPQTAAPNSLPTPAVIAIASAPQKVTRHAPS